MDKLKKLKDHYSLGDRCEVIKSSLNKDVKKQHPFMRFDGFHTRGREALAELLGMCRIDPEMNILDLGCGTGGTPRFISHESGAKVTGLDFSFDYLEAGKFLSNSLGVKGNFYINADASSLPFTDSSFDLVITEHLLMNIENKEVFYREIGRVLKSGGSLLFHEVYSEDANKIIYPLPWSMDSSISFPVDESYGRDLMVDSGMKIGNWELKNEVSFAFFEKVLKNIDSIADNPKGLNIVMGREYAEKVKNMALNLKMKAISIVMGKASKV